MVNMALFGYVSLIKGIALAFALQMFLAIGLQVTIAWMIYLTERHLPPGRLSIYATLKPRDTPNLLLILLLSRAGHNPDRVDELRECFGSFAAN